MHVPKDLLPVKIDITGAVARQAEQFGDTGPYGVLAGEHLVLARGADMAPLLRGLPDNACDSPHWGYVISGELIVTYVDGSEESCATSDLIYWPPGHSVRVVQDAEVVMFSPQSQHAAVMDHMLARLATA